MPSLLPLAISLVAWSSTSDGFRGILRGNRRAESAATAGHPARDGDCEKIRAGIPAAARRVNGLLDLGFRQCPTRRELFSASFDLSLVGQKLFHTRQSW